MTVYAHKGEHVLCENGHHVATVAQDIECNAIFMPEMLAGIEIKLCEPIPFCQHCGGLFGVGYWRGGYPVNSGFYFKEGFRLCIADEIRHFTKHPPTV